MTQSTAGNSALTGPVWPAGIARPAGLSHTTENLVLALVVAPGVLIAILLALGGAGDIGLMVLAGTYVIALILSPEVGLYGFCLIHALDELWRQDEESVLTPTKLIAPLLLLSYYLRANRVRAPIRVSQNVVLAAIAFGALGLLTVPLAFQWLAALRYAGQVTVLALLIGMALHRLGDRQTIGRALLATVASGALASALMLIGGGAFRTFTGRATISEFANPNSIALALSVSLLAIPPAWVLVRHTAVRAGLLVAAPMLMTAMLMTGSRSAALSVFGAVALSAVLSGSTGLGRRVLIPAVSLAIVAGTAWYAVSESDLLETRSRERLTEFVEQGGRGTGEFRFYIWRSALEVYASRPWGFGFGNTQFALEQTRGERRDIHSSLFGPLVDAGPLGLFLYVAVLVLAYRCVRRIREKSFVVPATMYLLLIVVFGLTHTIHFTKWFWIPLMFTSLLAEQDAREQLQVAARKRVRQWAQRLLAARVALNASAAGAPGGTPPG